MLSKQYYFSQVLYQFHYDIVAARLTQYLSISKPDKVNTDTSAYFCYKKLPGKYSHLIIKTKES